MKIAYCDCFSGISGDMFLGALLDAGLSLEDLRRDLASLGLDQAYELQLLETQIGSLCAARFKVVLTGEPGNSQQNLESISDVIKNSRLSHTAKETSLAIFQRLAEAEARVHGTTVEQIHFHEVGAIDSILDVTGAVVGLERLGIEKLYASSLPLGNGEVETSHGTLPLPAPATLELLASAHAPVHARQTNVELVTPTGAAILAALAKFERPNMVLQSIGTGAGERDLPWPNILRLWVGETIPQEPSDMVLLDTNIDDMNPEFFGHIMGRLFDSGALDVYMTPVYMKKNRPGTTLSVISRQEDVHQLARILLLESSTFGVRAHPISRYEAGRTMMTVNTIYGEVPVKLKVLDGEVVSAAPEYDVCSLLAIQRQVPVMAVYDAAKEAVTSGGDSA